MRPVTKFTLDSLTYYLEYNRSHYSVVMDDVVIGRIDVINSRMFRANGGLYDRLYMAARDLVRRKVAQP